MAGRTGTPNDRAAGARAAPTAKRRKKRRDWGRGVALFFCVIFAVVGIFPLALGLLVRTPMAQHWAADETSRLIHDELGIDASYEVEVRPWPLSVALRDVVVASSDDLGPFLTVEEVAVRPRFFSLLAGKLDVGDVEIIGPRARVVVVDGELKNLPLELPDTEEEEEDEPSTAPPLASLTVTDAHVDANIDGVLIAAREVDVDVSVEPRGAFEIAVRAGSGAVSRAYETPGRPQFDRVDDDVLCRLDGRFRVDKDGLLVRRLDVQASVDFDPAPGSAPACALGEDDWRRTEVHLSHFGVTFPEKEGELPTFSGHVALRAAVPVAHRFVDLPRSTGMVELDVELAPPSKGAKMPNATGDLTVTDVGIDGKLFSDQLKGKLRIDRDVLRLTDVSAHWSDGDIGISWVEIRPFAKNIPMHSGPVTVEGATIQGILRDVGVHPEAHVGWTLERADLDGWSGTLNPLLISSDLEVRTSPFYVYDRPHHVEHKRRLFGTAPGQISGEFRIDENRVQFRNMTVLTPRSRVYTTVGLRFESVLELDVTGPSTVDFDELSPIADVPIGGLVSVTASGGGSFDFPRINGKIEVDDFSIAGFEIGTVEHANVDFEPLALALSEVAVVHGQSRIRSDAALVDFDAEADVLVEANVDTTAAPHLDLRDFFEVFHLADDPRFDGINGLASGRAKVRYAIGGALDPCGGGALDVEAEADLLSPNLFGERYDGATLSASLRWEDTLAGDAGMDLNIPAITLKKGDGNILIDARVRPGGALTGNLVATGVPLRELDALGPLGSRLDGDVSVLGRLRGSLGSLEGAFDVSLSPIRIGPESLPASRLSVAIEPAPGPAPIGRTQCGHPITAPFDRTRWDADPPTGLFRIKGSLFDKQIRDIDLTVTQQRAKRVKGSLATKSLDLGILANLLPGVAFSSSPPSGELSARLRIDNLPVDDPARARAELELDEVHLSQNDLSLRLVEPTKPIELADARVEVPPIGLELRTSGGLSVAVSAGGKVSNLIGTPQLDLSARVLPIDLARLAADIDGVERMAGTARGQLSITGPATTPRYSGALSLQGGQVALAGQPMIFEDVGVDVVVDGREVRITKASARVGGGRIEATARIPVEGLSIGNATAKLIARDVRIPIADGIEATVDADLDTSYRPSDALLENQHALPDVKGLVKLTSFRYSRPISMSVDLDALSGAQRTEVEAYDPSQDFVRFNLRVVSPRPLLIENNLITMQLMVADPGLDLVGTNQRFGARGRLRILEESKIQLRNNEFAVREGYVRFDDLSKIAPIVEVRADTEYRRYAFSASADDDAASAGAGDAGSTAGGQWRINLHAHGDAENLELDLTSDPPLAQEDIILLLTVGMTRAEVDRSLASSLSSTVGLEVVSSLTGADEAVQTVVPIIDNFTFGSGYSSRTGRTEPNVTIGKRITDDVRANVTTTLTESDVSSTIEWRLKKGVSVQGAYDNVNDIAGSFGNLGADLRWRLEFE